MKLKYECGDVVICTKFDVNGVLIFDKTGIYVEPKITDRYFNRKAIVVEVDATRDMYAIEFLDNKEYLAWVYGEDLIFFKKEYMAKYINC